jgi:hypothetical protein
VFAHSFLSYKKGCTRLAAASDKVCQLLVHGQWFSPDTPASSTATTGRHDIAEILLKVALNTKIKSNVKIINFKSFFKYQIAIIVQLEDKWTDVFFEGFCFGHTTFHIVS